MLAMQLRAPGERLRPVELPESRPGAGELRVRVRACGVCRTDLHVVDGELRGAKLPIVPGHEIVGTVEEVGEGVEGFAPGARVGIPWLAWTCGRCRYCLRGAENLCEAARFTGYTRDGGYAEQALADARFCVPLEGPLDDVSMAPLLCAGLIGYRCLRAAGDPARLGLYGFGAAAHIVAQVAAFEGRRVFAFTRPGDAQGARFAKACGAAWAGGSDEAPPEPLDAAIVFAPVGALVPAALRAVDKGGTVVCGGIHMSDLPAFPYRLLWEERAVRSVANLTRRDAREFMALAPRVPVRTHTLALPLAQANEALARLRAGEVEGAAVLVPGHAA
jgi:propanol-preferring alcohol dehydrogenase